MSCLRSRQQAARPAVLAHNVCARPRSADLRPRIIVNCVLAEGSALQSQDSKTATLLLGDIGGTNARFELVDANVVTGEKGRSFIEIMPTSQYDTVEDAIAAFLRLSGEQGDVISSGALACAGPVVDNVCDMTNLKWVVDGDAIAKRFGMRTAMSWFSSPNATCCGVTKILNDFVAVGYGVPPLQVPDDVFVVHEGLPKEQGPKAVLGPGTGLGEAQLIWDSGLGGYVTLASEGSHGGFAPRGPLQRELLAFVEDGRLRDADPSLAFDFPCEVEHVACGSGLARIHRFFCAKHGLPHDSLEPADITARGLAETGRDEACSQAIDLFLDIIGAEAGAMALRSIATGGVYLAGGIPVRLGEERLLAGRLRAAYLNERAALAPVIAQCPFYILREEAGLKGVFNYAMALAKGER